MDSFKINFYLKKRKNTKYKETQSDIELLDKKLNNTLTEKEEKNLVDLEDRKYLFSILISLSWNGEVFRTTINIPIKKRLWDFNKQRVSSSSINPKKINDKLDEIKYKLNNFYDEIRHQKRYPEEDEVKNYISLISKDKLPKNSSTNKNEKVMSFYDHFLRFMNDTKNGVRLSSSGKRIQSSTFKSYITTQNHLKEFLSTTKTEYNFDNIDDKFFAEITKYFSKHNLSNNTQGRAIKIIKTFLHYMVDLGINKNMKFVKSLKVFDEETNIVALNKTELESIEKLSGLTDRLDRTKDLFLAQIYTGLRVSDLFNLKNVNINYIERKIFINTMKTQNNLIIPISRKLEVILKKHSGKLPKVSTQKYNVAIKEICKFANINTPIQVTRFIGNKRIVEVKPKYEMISSHTSRRSFITLTLKKGVMPEMVMEISGHKNRKSFQRYVRITKEESADKVLEAWDEN